MPEYVILAKSNADTSAALTAYTTPDTGDFTFQERGGVQTGILKRVDTAVAHTATDKGYVRISKTQDGTSRKPLLIPFWNTVGFAKGEDVVSMGKGYSDVNKPFIKNDVMEVAGQFEVASKDQGALMHFLYGSRRAPKQFENYPDHWVRHATSAPTVDVWSAGCTLNAADDGFDPQKTYALVGVKVEPGDTQGAIAFRCYPKSDATWKAGFVIVEGEYPMYDCPVFKGDVNFVIEQYNGIATVVSNLFLHFKEIG